MTSPEEPKAPVLLDFWPRLGWKGGMPRHMPMTLNDVGEGPVPPDEAALVVCWCGDECPLHQALRDAWVAGYAARGRDHPDT